MSYIYDKVFYYLVYYKDYAWTTEDKWYNRRCKELEYGEIIKDWTIIYVFENQQNSASEVGSEDDDAASILETQDDELKA